MENYIDIQYITNLINLGYDQKDCIIQIETLKTKIILLLNTNDVIIYDTVSTKKNSHHFNDKITYIKVHKDKLYLLSGSLLIWLNQETFEQIQAYNLKEKVYLVSFFDKQNLEIIYVTESNEIKYFAKGLLLKEDTSYNLYRESGVIHKLIYKNGILLWATSTSLKVFLLSKKKMLIKKIFSIPPNKNLLSNKVDCFLFNNLLCVNVHLNEIMVFRLPNENNDIPLPIEVVHMQTSLEEGKYYIGMWINSSLNKLSILLCENNIVKLQIKKININTSNSSSDFYFTKTFHSIISSNNDLFKFVFENNVFLFTDKEIYYMTLLDKSVMLFRDVQNSKRNINTTNLDIIYELYNKCDINEKYYLLTKIVLNENNNFLEKDKGYIERIGGMDANKFYYLYNSLFNSDSDKETNIKNIKILYNNFVLTLIKYSKLDILYDEIKKKFNSTLTSISKEKIIEMLLRKKQYNLLRKVVNDIKEIELNNKLENLFYSFLQQNKEPKEAVFIFGLINTKNKRYNTALANFISISNIEETFQILTSGNQELLFNYDKIFNLLDESKLLTILDQIYSKKSSLIVLFYERFFKLCSNKKIAVFTMYLVEYDKLRLVSNLEIGEKLFKITLENGGNIPQNVVFNYITVLQKFIENYETFDHIKLINDNIELLKSKNNYEVYISLLVYTKNYKEIINIFIEVAQNPEKCINFIEDTNIEDVTKEDIYEYLKQKIKETKSLSNIKKFYFLFQFQDDVTIGDPNCLKLLENISNENDNLEYILFILEQLKLKVNILDLSKTVSQNNLKEFFDERTKVKLAGIKISFQKALHCEYDNCDKNNKFEPNDTITIFKQCCHLYHKECFDKFNFGYGNIKNTNNCIECPLCSQMI